MQSCCPVLVSPRHLNGLFAPIPASQTITTATYTTLRPDATRPTQSNQLANLDELTPKLDRRGLPPISPWIAPRDNAVLTSASAPAKHPHLPLSPPSLQSCATRSTKMSPVALPQELWEAGGHQDLPARLSQHHRPLWQAEGFLIGAKPDWA